MRISDWSSDVCSSYLLAAACREQRIERLGLRGGAGIAVEDQTDIGAELIDPLTDDPLDYLVGDQFARVQHGLRLEPDLGARLDRGAQHIPGRKLHHAAIGDQTARLRPLARPRRPEQDDIHGNPPLRRQSIRTAAPVRPFSTNPPCDANSGTSAQPRALQFRLLDEIAILMREQVRSEEHTSELQSLMRISYAVFCLKKKKQPNNPQKLHYNHTINDHYP